MNRLDLNRTEALPDVAGESRLAASPLAWVGMEHVELPIRIDIDASLERCAARARVGVDLQSREVRGIHMSRLYRVLDRCLANQTLSVDAVAAALHEMRDSHAELSTSVDLELCFDLALRRPALVSDNRGWRIYPAGLSARLDDRGLHLELGIDVLYSSTCPSSAALTRQLIQRRFASDFAARESVTAAEVSAWLVSEAGLAATPHAQRSTLQLRVRLEHRPAVLPFVELIDCVERVLATPVQTAVKREDEQAFAALNGANLMFCEDAARRVAAAMHAEPAYSDFWLRAAHHESLHPHDAVAIAVKGIDGGYSLACPPRW